MPIEKQNGSRLIRSGLFFTTLPNKSIDMIQDPVALAIWVHLTSKPPNWIIHKSELMKRFGLGIDRYTKAMRELRELGLVWDFIERNGEGLITDRALVCSSVPDPDKRKDHRDTGKPISRENPYLGENHITGNGIPLVSKDLSYKELKTYKNDKALSREKVSSTMDQLTDTSWAKGLLQEKELDG